MIERNIRRKQRLTPGKSWAAALGGILMVGTLAGCALLEGPPVDRPERPTPSVPSLAPEETPEFVPNGTADENELVFVLTLNEAIDQADELGGRLLVDSLVDIGFERERMQVSFDRTPTNLLADSLYVSVMLGEECLVGQVDTATKELFVSASEAVGPNSDLCLIGHTRPIDW